MYFIYGIITNIIILFSPLIFFFRILKRKEDPKRFLEKYSSYSVKNSSKIIWIHAASVGEMMSIIPILKKLEKNKKLEKIILTTTTISSAKIFNKLKIKFKKTFHKYYPLDTNYISKKFIKNWKPKLAIFVDSEIWPNTLKNLESSKIPIILLNARITKKSFKRWSLISIFAKNVFSKITLALPQNLETKRYLKKLGVKKIKLAGNLKYYGDRKFRNLESKAFEKKFKNFKIWCAASTHETEEILIANLHKRLKKKINNLLTIIIPRHINRSHQIIKDLEKLNLNTITHSSNNRLKKNDDIYLVDTYGESSKFFKLSKVSFVGGSIIKHGGQNPLEPARLGNYILNGTNIDNFKEIYAYLIKNKLSSTITSRSFKEKIIERKLDYKMSNKNKDKIFKIGDKVLKQNLLYINKFIK